MLFRIFPLQRNEKKGGKRGKKGKKKNTLKRVPSVKPPPEGDKGKKRGGKKRRGGLQTT